MITPHDTAQYGQMLRVSVVRAIFNSRISARALFRSKPRATPPLTAAPSFKKVRRSTGHLRRLVHLVTRDDRCQGRLVRDTVVDSTSACDPVSLPTGRSVAGPVMHGSKHGRARRRDAASSRSEPLGIINVPTVVEATTASGDLRESRTAWIPDSECAKLARNRHRASSIVRGTTRPRRSL